MAASTKGLFARGIGIDTTNYATEGLFGRGFQVDDTPEPGSAGEIDASDRIIKQSGIAGFIRRSAFIIALLLLGAL